MSLGWNEIHQRAARFAQEWADETREDAEAQTFWNEFFEVFGVKRRRVAIFEAPVRTLKGTYGAIDLFWKGTLLAEHKSAGGRLDKAESQAFQYLQDLQNQGRDVELPRHIVISDFRHMVLYDLEAEPGQDPPSIKIRLKDLPKNIKHFGFIAGYKQQRFDPEDPVNIQAAERMGLLHDALRDSGYQGHELERMLVRLLFCLFADDTRIFESQTFDLLLHATSEDGADVGPLLEQVFQVLNTPESRRQKNLDEPLAALPYVNGGLFEERLSIANFDAPMRKILLNCSRFDWSGISPAVFGALFQSVMEPAQRRRIGAHYTSERDILKVIGPLFLDELKAEFQKIKKNKRALERFHEKLASLSFLDPACGCGNFLVITYREIRKLEIEVLHAMDVPLATDLWHVVLVNVEQFYGIEIEEWPVRIAEVALWLMDHQMNGRIEEAFGKSFARLPMKQSPHIVCGNALRLDWRAILPPGQCSYVLSNPPFGGSKFLNAAQRADMDLVARSVKNHGVLDYVTAWYFKAADYIRGTRIKVGFVSTNSVSQGEQPGILWGELFRRGVKIHFAHRTFAWESEARGKAHVHVVIIGFGAFDTNAKVIFEYDSIKSRQASAREVSNVNPYLVEGLDTVLLNRTKPLCNVPMMGIGNKPIDNGNYLFTEKAKDEFLSREPGATSYFHPWLGSDEYINGKTRWCLWLGDCSPEKLKSMPLVMKRIEAVRQFRKASRSIPTNKLADFPTRFHVENMPKSEYFVVPKVSSERRTYIPMGFLRPSQIASDLCMIITNANLYHFGVLTSAIHMAWVRQVCGRLKSDFRYSSGIVYNNFPWPKNPSEKQKKAIEDAARRVLSVRDKYPEASLADLYDPLTMPPNLVKAHQVLDRVVDRCYRPQPFASDRQRVEFLFALYEEYTVPLLSKSTARRARSKL